MTKKQKPKAPKKRAPREWTVGTMHVRWGKQFVKGQLHISVDNAFGASRDSCVFRGDREACIELLEDAMRAMRGWKGG